MKPDSSASTIERPLRRAFFYASPVDLAPPIDGFLIALASTPRWLLAAPAKPTQQPPDARLVVLDAELASNQLGDAWQGPQLGGPAMPARPLLQQLDQPLALVGG
jgi:hypothetical protein